MSSLFLTAGGKRIVLGAELGRGGEGVIYQIQGAPGECAKVYTRRPTADTVAKLRCMTTKPPRDPTYCQPLMHRSLCWPSDVLLAPDGSREPRGFVMPRINLKIFQSIENCIVVQHRVSALGYGYSWRHLWYTARNLCSAVAALHERDYCVGDLNAKNVLVSGETLVSIVDCDSFQVRDAERRRTYRCVVGRPEYTAPEIQGHSYADVDRTPQSDAFALAILVFQLLMEGTYPFAAKGPAVDKAGTPELKLKLGHYPYRPGVRGVAPPEHAPPIEILGKPLADLMLRYFGTGLRNPLARPSARELLETLGQPKLEFRRCDRNSSHVYLPHLKKCPWCERAERRGIDPFPEALGGQIPIPDVRDAIDTPERRRMIFREHYVRLALADGEISPEEAKHLHERADKLQIPWAEAARIVEDERAKVHKKGGAPARGTPVLSLDPRQCEFSELKQGARTSGMVTVVNAGGGILSGTVRGDQPWILPDSEALDTTVHRQQLQFSIDTKKLPPGFYGQGHLVVESNGGRGQVAVSVRMEAPQKAISRLGLKLGLAVSPFGLLLGSVWSSLMPTAIVSVSLPTARIGALILGGMCGRTLGGGRRGFWIAAGLVGVLWYLGRRQTVSFTTQLVVLWGLMLFGVGLLSGASEFRRRASGGSVPWGLILRTVFLAAGVFAAAALWSFGQSELNTRRSERSTERQDLEPRKLSLVYVNGSNVNVRANPSTSARVVKRFQRGRRVFAKSVTGDWVLVTEDAEGSRVLGWIHRRYLRTNG